MASPSSTLQELIPFEINSSDIQGLEDEDTRGSGSYGAVYAVTVRGTSRIAKRLHSILVGADVNQSEKQGIRERFLNECLLLSKLDHQNVVKFVGVHFSPEDRSDVTLIMEQLHMDLDKFLDPDQRPVIDTFTKLSILLDVSSGLLYLHTQLAKPMIHRDLTAGNVLLTEDFKRAKIADLGVSKLIDHHLHRAVTRTACPGTLAYMPPEALTDKPKYDTPLDVFSFGQLSLYVALQQFPQVAFELPPDQSIRAYQLGEVAILKRKKWLDMLPEDHCLRDLILSSLRDDPSERPTTERLNVKMKVLCGLELEEFEIKDVIGIIDGELYGSYTAVYKIIARGAPRIAKRLNSVLDSELHSDISPSERQCIRERFHSECLALSKLDHPNILKFVGVHFNPEDRSDMSVIFEHLHMSLEEFLTSQEFPDIHLNTKLSILCDVSCGLLYLHTQLELPFTHSELTAANVLITEDMRQAKIADLGVLKLRDSYVNKEPKNIRALAYLPPDAILDNPKRATPIDIFSFGHLALYVALQQFPEISEEEVLTVTRKKREIEILRRKKWIDELEQDHCLRDLILRCLKDEPEKRPTARELNNIMSGLNNAINPERKTKRDVALQSQFADLCRVCRNGELDLLKDFLYYKKEILTYQPPPSYTSVLHEAVEGDQPDVIQLLILHGFNPDLQAKGGLTPLHLAVTKEKLSCVRALIDSGADMSIRDDRGQDAINKAEIRSKKSKSVLNLLHSKEIVILAEKGDIHGLEKRLKQQTPKPELRDIEEAMLAAIRNGIDECVPLLVVAGAQHLDCALYLAIQLERIKVIATLLLCKATISGDAAAIRLLLSEPPESANVPWYMPKVHKILSQGNVKMSYPIAVSIFEKKYEATKELLLRTDVDMGRKQVDWSKLKLTTLHSSWMYSIAPWVVSLKLTNNHLRKLPSELSSATQLRRLDVSKNLLESVSPDLFSLPNLEFLSLSDNRLKEIPETSNWSGSLLSLDLSFNLLSTLPQGIQHSSIEIFNLSRNQFSVIPKCICRICTLTSLDLSYNLLISSLPREMEQLDRLVNLNISGTNISGGGVLRGGIKGKFKAQARSNKPCNHVKLVLICHMKVYKHVMLSRLKPHFSSSSQFLSLPEIDAFQWSFKPLFSRKDKVYFNTWLMGSSHSFRSIYPCFFTPSALHAIVCDLMTVDAWEQIKPYIDLLVRYVPSANVLIIAILPEGGLTSEKEMATKLNEIFSKPGYASLIYHGLLTMAANPNVKVGQGDLKQRLYETAQQMIVNGQQVVGRQIPETYLSLISVFETKEQILRPKSNPVILKEGDIWTQLSKALASDPPDREELPAIVDFLKEAGFLLHYEDPNDSLDQYYFIQPTWLYNTLLQVMRQAVEHHSKLLITPDELCSSGSSVDTTRGKGVTQALIRLMIRYAIILPVHRDLYLVTCLLPNVQPSPEALFCGTLRRQFAPKAYKIPIDLWSRLLCAILHNLSKIVDVSNVKDSQSRSKETGPDVGDRTDKQRSDNLDQGSATDATDIRKAKEGSTSPLETAQSSWLTSSKSSPAKCYIIDKGVEMWDSGMIYNHEGIKFSIFPCVSEVSTVEERGIEICCTRDDNGYIIMARLCWLVQTTLEERFPHLFSTQTPLQKHELVQMATCPTCLERKERNPTCFLVEMCIHALQLKGEHNCRYHPEAIPLRDLIPDYLLLNFPPRLHLTKSMFEYNEAEPLHRGRQMVLFDGRFNGKEVAIKIYHQVDRRSVTLPLSYVRRETDMLSLLNHPNIIKTFGLCLDPPCVLMEKAPLGNLYQKLVDTEVKINRTVRFHIANQVASALSYLHRRDIIYRTLKASSILLWSLDFKCEASIKLANFERAAYQSPSGLVSKTTFSSYPAPEMLRYSFREEYTEKVDIYSFGMFLYELVTRWQPYGGTSNGAHSPQKPKLSGMVTTSYSTMVKLMQECWQDESMARPSADDLLLQLSQPSFQCHLASQVLRDCVSVRGCCFVPSVRQIWVYGEYDAKSPYGMGEIFILNAENLTIQGSLILSESATSMFTVDNRVWIGLGDSSAHAYDTTTFQLTDRFCLDDSAMIIGDNDYFVLIGQANGKLKCYSKLQLQRGNRQPVDVEIGDKAILTMVTVGDIIWIGCGNELVILSAEDDIVIKRRAEVCESSDQVVAMTVSHNTNIVWCISRSSHRITSWDLHTTELKQSVDLSEQLIWICCELNFDPSSARMVSIECISDTLWVGLSCGVIMILSDAEHPEKITHFNAHKQATDCLLKIPQNDVLHQQHDYPTILSGGFGEVSSLSSKASEQNGVVMLWQACTMNEFSTIAKRHANCIYVYHID